MCISFMWLLKILFLSFLSFFTVEKIKELSVIIFSVLLIFIFSFYFSEFNNENIYIGLKTFICSYLILFSLISYLFFISVSYTI